MLPMGKEQFPSSTHICIDLKIKITVQFEPEIFNLTLVAVDSILLLVPPPADEDDDPAAGWEERT